MTLLLLSDAPDKYESIVKYLAVQDITIRKHTLSKVNSIPFDDYSLVILDICDSGGKPKDFLYRIRLVSNVPVFVLTDDSSESTRASLYDTGADGIINRSDDPQTVLSMIRAFLRRFSSVLTPAPTNDPIGLTPVPSERAIMVGNHPVSLSQAEFDTFLLLLNNPNKIITRSEFMEHARLFGHSTTDNTLNIQIARIRNKCGFTNDHPIETIRGVGYRLNTISSQAA
jgi:DNA-binding response OmpR family regulator